MPALSSRDPELLMLRKLAEELAQRRNERPTTGHLLAAIATQPGAACDLLRDRRLDVEVLLKAARVATEDAPDAVARCIGRAKDFALRSPTREAGAVHLLFALCQDRGSAAHRAIEQCGSDVSKLRAAAMQVAMGILPARRVSSPPPGPSAMQLALPRVGAAGAARPRRGRRDGAMEPGCSSVGLSPPRPPLGTPSTNVAPVAAVSTSTVPAKAAPMKVPVNHAVKPVAARPEPPPASPEPKAMPADAEARFEIDPKQAPLLAQLGKNLTLAAARHELDPVVGREEEVERTLDVLAKRHANSACLIGVTGVGKTSVARGVALRVAGGAGVSPLDQRILIEIEVASLLAGTAARGSLAERIAQLKAEVKACSSRIVLFFDEIHTLFADGGDEGVAELKMALAKGDLVCIGATSREDYRRTIECDPTLARRFTAVDVDELSPEQAFIALESNAPALEAHHQLRYEPQALAASVTWSVRYLPGRALPDKALQVLDLAGARARRRGLGGVSREQIAEVVAEITGVPEERLLESDGERMLRLESLLGERIVGHKEPLARIAAVLRRNASGLRSRRPIGTFLLLGPTGVGKTETAKAIAECLFFSSDAMTRLDLSEYAEAHAVSRLVGAPPGYVGHEAGGQLTEVVRRRPYQVILLDEIEKAHRDVLEAFLQVFDEGRLTDGRGRTVDFTNTVLLLTSNLGAEVAVPTSSSRARIGFARGPAEAAVQQAYAEAVVSAARAGLPPELYNRLDEVLAFAPLTRTDVGEVARRMILALGAELEAMRGIRLDVSESAIDVLLDEGGFEASLGARPMRRAIARLVEAPLAELMLRSELQRGDVATVDVESGKIVVDAVRGTARTEQLTA